MDQNLLRSYLATIYEVPTPTGVIRVSMDGDASSDPSILPAPLTQSIAIVTAYNPRSMLLPRRVNETRQQVLRDLLILGVYRVEHCIGYEDDPDGVWREPAWFVHNMDRDEAMSFGRVFRQNTVVWSSQGVPEIIVTDPTCDEFGKTYKGVWRVRS